MAATLLTALVALEHLYFLVLEMFLWTKPAGLRALRQTRGTEDRDVAGAAGGGGAAGQLALTTIVPR